MDVYEIPVKEDGARTDPPDEQPQSLPVCLYLPEPKRDAEEETVKPKGRITKILSLFFSLLFCGASLLYIASGVVALSDRHGEEDFKRMLINEVYPDAVIETAAPEESAEDTEQLFAIPFEPIPDDAEEPEKPSEAYPVAAETLANFGLLSSLSNETSYEPDMEKLLAEARGNGKCAAIYGEFGADAPVVLIVHTHGTEAYMPEGRDTYTTEDPFRSHDRDENVVSVGDVMAKVLESEGVNVLHCTEMFDEESYRDSYSRSYAAVAEYLEKYPSVSYVLDVHRDSIIRDDMTNISTLAYLGETRIAQAMIVVGTNEGGANHPDWEDNLSFALSVQENMISKSETLPRKINLRCAAFNQGLCPGFLLLEIGSCGNTLREAKCAAVLTAMSVAEAVKGEKSSLSPEDALSVFVP